jgi:hypothetical protein
MVFFAEVRGPLPVEIGQRDRRQTEHPWKK